MPEITVKNPYRAANGVTLPMWQKDAEDWDRGVEAARQAVVGYIDGLIATVEPLKDKPFHAGYMLLLLQMKASLEGE